MPRRAKTGFQAPSGVVVLAEHQNAENTRVDATGPAGDYYYTAHANGATIVSQSITTTKRCCIVVVTVVVHVNSAQKTQIQRGGVDKTTETTISAVNQGVNTGYIHLQYASEVLDAGIYTYSLINTFGAAMNCVGGVIKIVAVSGS